MKVAFGRRKREEKSFGQSIFIVALGFGADSENLEITLWSFIEHNIEISIMESSPTREWARQQHRTNGREKQPRKRKKKSFLRLPLMKGKLISQPIKMKSNENWTSTVSDRTTNKLTEATKREIEIKNE